jgi:hypothetical protein
MTKGCAVKNEIPVPSTAECRPVETNDDLQKLFGPAPLLEGEDIVAYNCLRSHIRSAVAPKDVIEEIWVRDVIDLFWETIRLRRLKSKLIRAASPAGLKEVLRSLVGPLGDQKLVDGWATRDGASIKEVDRLLHLAQLDQEAITAQTLAVKLDTFERIDRLIMQSEARRNMVLREIDRHRDAWARRLREVSNSIEDGEFTEIATSSTQAGDS